MTSLKRLRVLSVNGTHLAEAEASDAVENQEFTRTCATEFVEANGICFA
jgi:hypothetical protein